MTKDEEKVLENWIRENLTDKPITTEHWFIAYLFHKQQKLAKERMHYQDENFRLKNQLSYIENRLRVLEKTIEYEQNARRASIEALSAALDTVLPSKQA